MTEEHGSGRGRHRPFSVQLKAWIPSQLRDDFAAACRAQGMTSSTVLRGLLLAYVKNSAGTARD